MVAQVQSRKIIYAPKMRGGVDASFFLSISFSPSNASIIRAFALCISEIGDVNYLQPRDKLNSA